MFSKKNCFFNLLFCFNRVTGTSVSGNYYYSVVERGKLKRTKEKTVTLFQFFGQKLFYDNFAVIILMIVVNVYCQRATRTIVHKSGL